MALTLCPKKPNLIFWARSQYQGNNPNKQQGGGMAYKTLALDSERPELLASCMTPGKSLNLFVCFLDYLKNKTKPTKTALPPKIVVRIKRGIICKVLSIVPGTK